MADILYNIDFNPYDDRITFTKQYEDGIFYYDARYYMSGDYSYTPDEAIDQVGDRAYNLMKDDGDQYDNYLYRHGLRQYMKGHVDGLANWGTSITIVTPAAIHLASTSGGDYYYNLGRYWLVDGDTVTEYSSGDWARVRESIKQSVQEQEDKQYEESAKAVNDMVVESLVEQKKIASLENLKRVNIITKMHEFKDMLIKLHNKFNRNRAVYTMYFKMRLRDDNGNYERILIDTTSNDWYNNNLISFTHKINGSGEANTFTLDILFKPNDRNIKTINMLEAKLIATCAAHKSETELKEENEIYANCKFQYGYGDEINMRSPEYTGSIMEYDCKIENGNLHYTITGYCGLYAAKEYRISPKAEYLTDSAGGEITNPLLYIQRIFEVEFKDNNLYTVEIINIDAENVVYPGDTYKNFAQNNIFQVIKDILAGCMTKDQYDACAGVSEDGSDTQTTKSFLPNQKQIFNYFIDTKKTETSGECGTVYIYKMESLYGEENAGKTVDTVSADCDIEFSWFAPTINAFNHVVRDWHPKYEGAELMGLAVTWSKSNHGTYYTMTDSGEIQAVRSLGAARLGISDTDRNNAILTTIQEYSNWSFVTQYPYSATMTLLGVPCEVPMSGKIKVLARMGDEFHHSSGLYQILEKTDKINSSGFFSELQLFKITPGYNPKYLEDTVVDTPPTSDTPDYVLAPPTYDPSIPGATSANGTIKYIQNVTYNGNMRFGYVFQNEESVIMDWGTLVHGKYVYDYNGQGTKLGYITDDGTIVIY